METSSRPSNPWAAALLASLAGLVVAIVLAGLLAPAWLFVALALCVFNVLRQVDGVAHHGLSVAAVVLLAINVTAIAFTTAWLLVGSGNSR